MKPLIHFIFLLFFTIQLCCSLTKFRYGCPTDQKRVDLSPCTCSQTLERANWKTVVTCCSFNDYRKLKKSLNAINGYKIDELVLKGLNMKYLPDDVFINDAGDQLVEIETVTIKKSKIGNIAQPVNSAKTNAKSTFFTGLGTSMRELRIECSGKVAQFNWKRLVDSLSGPDPIALKNLLFYNNDMEILPASFDNFTLNNILLDRVVLQWNGIRKIEATLLFPEMTLLDLSRNKIESIDDLFKDLTNEKKTLKIETIFLKNNKITILREDSIFWKLIANDKTPSLTYIDLRKNLIDCKCENTGWIIKTKLDSKVQIDAKCYSPREVCGKSIMDMCFSSAEDLSDVKKLK